MDTSSNFFNNSNNFVFILTVFILTVFIQPTSSNRLRLRRQHQRQHQNRLLPVNNASSSSSQPSLDDWLLRQPTPPTPRIHHCNHCKTTSSAWDVLPESFHQSSALHQQRVEGTNSRGQSFQAVFYNCLAISDHPSVWQSQKFFLAQPSGHVTVYSNTVQHCCTVYYILYCWGLAAPEKRRERRLSLGKACPADRLPTVVIPENKYI